MEKTTFSVPSITCSVCSNKIQNGLQSMNGVENVSVDLKTKTVNVEYDPSSVQPQELRSMVSSLGYEVTK